MYERKPAPHSCLPLICLCQLTKLFGVGYKYPNANLFHIDELIKRQQLNTFLAEPPVFQM